MFYSRGGKNVLLNLKCPAVVQAKNSLFWVVSVMEMLHRCEQPSPVTMETGDETAGSRFPANQKEVVWKEDPVYRGFSGHPHEPHILPQVRKIIYCNLDKMPDF